MRDRKGGDRVELEGVEGRETNYIQDIVYEEKNPFSIKGKKMLETETVDVKL